MGGLVVVTGASTGIGRATVERLASSGFDVVAGVRSAEAAEQLRGERVEPAIVDVTVPDQVAALGRQVGDRPLAGLVNNAGISLTGPLEFFELDEFRRQLEVNLVGHVAVIQALLGAVRRGGGRIVSTGSVGAHTPLPFNSAYAASKTGLWAMSESLRGELRPWGIHVAVVEPGAIATPIWDKMGEQTAQDVAELPPRARELYGAALDRAGAVITKMSRSASPPEKVAAVIERALTERRPKDRYLVGLDAKGQALARRLLGHRRWDSVLQKQMGL
jgi:NAD(P)-dependent dehydrogenase (short-subunit alcohol dehydrogenase family)